MNGGRKKGTIGVSVVEIFNERGQGWGGVCVETSNVNRRGDAVEVPNKERGEGGGGG